MLLKIIIEDKFINVLKYNTGVYDNIQLTKEAFLFLNWAVKEISLGRIIVSMNEDNSEKVECILPCFKKVKINKI